MNIDRLYYLQISFKIVNYKIEKGMLSLLRVDNHCFKQSDNFSRDKRFLQNTKNSHGKTFKRFPQGPG